MIGGTGNNVVFNQSGCSPTPSWSCQSNYLFHCSCNSDADCADGLFCNGVETCVNLFCNEALDPCLMQGLVCDEANSQCDCNDFGDCIDNDVCTFDSCPTNDQCVSMTYPHGDVVGPNGSCGPDGSVTQKDVDAIKDVVFGGTVPAGCSILNFDIQRDCELCQTDGKVTVFDWWAAIDAAFGSPQCCGSGGSGSTPPGSPILILDPTPVYATPGGPVIAWIVDVHIYGYNAVGGYQVALDITGAQAGDVQVTQFYTDDTKPTYVFAKTASGDRAEAFDTPTLHMMAAKHVGSANMRSYLTSIRVEPAPGAATPITVTVGTTSNSIFNDPTDECAQVPAGDQTILTFD